jgi:hypothetical protein
LSRENIDSTSIPVPFWGPVEEAVARSADAKTAAPMNAAAHRYCRFPDIVALSY